MKSHESRHVSGGRFLNLNRFLTLNPLGRESKIKIKGEQP